MQNRKEIIREFFEIKPYLDRANKLKNEKTTLKLLVRLPKPGQPLQLIAYVTDAPDGPFILLCEVFRKKWKPVEMGGFQNLKEFCANELNISMKNLIDQFDETIGIEEGRKLNAKFDTLLIGEDSAP